MHDECIWSQYYIFDMTAEVTRIDIARCGTNVYPPIFAREVKLECCSLYTYIMRYVFVIVEEILRFTGRVKLSILLCKLYGNRYKFLFCVILYIYFIMSSRIMHRNVTQQDIVQTGKVWNFIVQET